MQTAAVRFAAFALVLAIAEMSAPGRTQAADPGAAQAPMKGPVRIVFLHHSTGGKVWEGGVPEALAAYNAAHGTRYQIVPLVYPDTSGGYPWANYPYDYWNLWVQHTGERQAKGEMNLDQLAARYDVIVFKHCFPVSGIGSDSESLPPRVSSEARTAANYRLQYAALKARMRQFPDKRFIVWTGAALTEKETDPKTAQRARQFFDWVKKTWDEPGDNIYVWDFWDLETEGGLFLPARYSSSSSDSHPNPTLSRTAAPLLAQRIVDVIEGRGDTGSLTGR